MIPVEFVDFLIFRREDFYCCSLWVHDLVLDLLQVQPASYRSVVDPKDVEMDHSAPGVCVYVGGDYAVDLVEPDSVGMHEHVFALEDLPEELLHFFYR